MAKGPLRVIRLAVVSVLVIAAGGCEMLEGNQYSHAPGGGLVLSGTATNELKAYVEQHCEGDASCLVTVLQSAYIENPAATDAGGDDLVDRLIAAAGAGALDGPLAIASAGQCLAISSAGVVSLVGAAESECIRGSSLIGASASCDFSRVPDGSVGVGWDDPATDNLHVVERLSDGSWSIVHEAADNVEFRDSSAPAGADYRLRTRSPAGSQVSVVACDEIPFEYGVDPEDVPLPTTDDGAFGGEGGGTDTPQRRPLPDHPASTTPSASVDLCSGATFRQQVSPTVAPPSYARVTIPPGDALWFDVTSFKSPVTDDGNWNGALKLYRIEPDGSVGAEVRSNRWSEPYYWDGRSTMPHPNRVLRNSSSDTELYLRIEVEFGPISIASTTSASFEVSNVRIVDHDSGEVIGRPCDEAEIMACRELGGNYYLPEPLAFDGETYQGCVVYDSCVGNMPRYAAFLNGLQEWACEHDDLLERALIVGGIVVLVLGGIVVLAGSAPAAAAALSGSVLARTSAVGVAASTVTTASTVGDVLVATSLLVGPSAIAYGGIEALRDDDMGIQQFAVDEHTGAVTITGGSMGQDLYDRGDYESQLDPTATPTERDVLRILIVRAIEACLLTIDDASRVAIMAQLGLTGPGLVFEVGGVRRHLCELISIYLPGGITKTTRRPIGQATAHINEVLYDTPPVFTEQHTGQQPPLPQPQWHLLTRTSRARTSWYTSPPYDCEATDGVVSNCDEWPWQATTAGGAPAPGSPQPRLRIIRASDNQIGGRELKTFYSPSECDVDLGEVYLVAPAVGPLLAPGWNGDEEVPPIASEWACAR